MLDPFRYSQPIVDVYAACVDELLINLARHFNVKGTGNSGSFSYQTRMLAKMGAINHESAAIIARHVKENEPMIQLAVEQAMLEAIAKEEPQLLEAARQGLLHDANIPVQESIQKQLTAYSRQAMQQTNLVNTVMLEGTWKAYQDGVYQAANILKQMDVAQTALNTETGKVITGVSTRQQAVRSAVKKMAEVGITGFIDNGGHKWSPEAYVQMDIKTTCSNAARQAVFDRNRDYGNDLVWVRINATARPKCYPWQGKVISTEGRSGSTTDLDGREILFHSIHDTSYGEPDGLWGINCHHGPPNVFIPGLSSIHGSVPDPDDNAAAYALTQQQRKLERDVRAAKREAAMLDAAGDKEGFEKAALRLKHRQQLLKDFAEENNLYLRSDRTQVHGYGRSQAARVRAYDPYESSFPILRSLGAKAANYEIVDKQTGIVYHFVEGQKIKDAKTFAGYGGMKPLEKDTLDGLCEEFPRSSRKKWAHRKGIALIENDGEEVKAEVHWFQEENVGKVKFKVKKFLDED
ncbi:MAG: hypothetical protein IJ392_02440 [Clostridia bacterium]|nr:hypothetical protein [Clostridia bacterium]